MLAELGALLAFRGAQRLDEGGEALRARSRRERRRLERDQDRAGVAGDADVGGAVLAELRRIAVDLHQLCLRVDGGAVADPEVERRSHHHHQVGGAKRLFARQVEGVRMLGRERAPPHPVGERGHPQPLGE